MTPTKMKAIISGLSCKYLANRPTERRPTVGQKSISKRLKILPLVMIKFLNRKARIFVHSLRKLKENLLQIRLRGLDLRDRNARSPQPLQNGAHSLCGAIHHKLTPTIR